MGRRYQGRQPEQVRFMHARYARIAHTPFTWCYLQQGTHKGMALFLELLRLGNTGRGVSGNASG